MTAQFIENATKLQSVTSARGELFSSERRQFASALPGRGLGCRHFSVPPGKTAFPVHSHHANDEALYILTGNGSLRYGELVYPVVEGDFIYLPAAGPVHGLTATGNAALVYLCISTMIHPEVVEYSDSQKVGAMTGRAPGGDPTTGNVVGFFPLDRQVDYFDGE